MKRQQYFNELSLEKSRLIFRRNCGFLGSVRMNFKQDKKYKAEKYRCPDCLNLNPPLTHTDHQDFLTSCEGNKDLRTDLSLDKLEDLAEYFRRIIERRIHRYGG